MIYEMKVVNIAYAMIKLQFKLPQTLISQGFTRRTVLHAPAFQQKGINRLMDIYQIWKPKYCCFAGKAVYFVGSLLDMCDFGGVGADSLKKGIDSIFEVNGSIPLSESNYLKKLVSATSDGAAVNFGHQKGLMVRLSEGCIWLIKIHCRNHR